MPRYSIVTPTLCRPSLVEACRSVDSQNEGDWEHIVVIDLPRLTKREDDILAQLIHAQRKFWLTRKAFRDYGNTPRRMGHEIAEGDYILHLDDDDRYADDDVLGTLNRVTGSWALFPIRRAGAFYFPTPTLPPCNGNLIFKRRGAPLYPRGSDYGNEAEFISRLRDQWGPPQLLTDCRALLNYDTPHFGDGTAEMSDNQIESDKKLFAEIEAMPADEYKKRMMSDKAWAARIESAYTRKWLASESSKRGSRLL